jgi:surfactin synthase thioesterase subunit
VAHRLEAQGSKVDLLVALAHPGPSEARNAVEGLRRLSEEKDMAKLMHTLGISKRMGAELFEAIWPMLRADLELLVPKPGYEGPKVSCPVLAVAGKDDLLVNRTALTAWATCTTGPFDLRTLNGPHLVLENSLQELVVLLNHAFQSDISAHSPQGDPSLVSSPEWYTLRE